MARKYSILKSSSPGSTSSGRKYTLSLSMSSITRSLDQSSHITSPLFGGANQPTEVATRFSELQTATPTTVNLLTIERFSLTRVLLLEYIPYLIHLFTAWNEQMKKNVNLLSAYYFSGGMSWFVSKVPNHRKNAAEVCIQIFFDPRWEQTIMLIQNFLEPINLR